MDPVKSLHTVNPFTLETLNRYSYEDLGQIREKTQHAHSAFRDWSRVPVAERAALVGSALHYFREHAAEIAGDITRQMGKPIIQAEKEIATFLERAEYLCGAAEDALRIEELPRQGNLRRSIERVPLGVVLVIAAWNYPLLIAANGVVTALLAGNTVILKHSRLTPSIGEHFEKAFRRMGGWNDLLQNVIADHDTMAGVIESGDVQHVIFTGSVEGGRRIYASTASTSKGFMDCQLELGGKDGAYVAEDADPLRAAEGLVDGAMYNAGQSCCGIERVYVHEAVYDAFLDNCLELAAAYVMGDPWAPSTTMGPLAAPENAEVLERQVNQAMGQGATIRLGGEKKTIGRGLFFAPTVVTEVHQGMDMMRHENFGPILPIMKVRNDTEAFRHVADSPYGLTSVIYTADPERAFRFAKEMDTGTVFMNRCDYLDPALPWTGVRNSGKGSTLSKYGFHSLTRLKAFNFRIPE